MSTWTGPGSVGAVAVRIARPIALRQCRCSVCGSPAAPSSTTARACGPNSPTWSMVWLAPVPRNSGGRLAVSASTGTPECAASTIAGCRLATAVPEVTTTGTGRLDPSANPRAVKAATRSSIRTCRRSDPARSAAARARARGALRDPGHSTASVTPWRTSSSTSTRACAVLGLLAPGAPPSGSIG